MRAELLQLAADLAKRGEPYVLAMVVRREPYSSAQQGDMAVITADGGYHGWLGGNCSQPTVKREARRALAEGKPRLVSLTPDPEQELRPGVRALPMTCHSGGSVDIYLEPVLPAPRLLLFGASPVVRALAQLGKAMGYAVDVVSLGADASSLPAADRVMVDLNAPELRAGPRSGERLCAVVATMGIDDEGSIAAAVAARAPYIGVVASRRRFAELRKSLLARGIAAEVLDAIHNPAGLDIGAHLPEEVALSILAEIVRLAKAGIEAQPAAGEGAAPEAKEAVDPVCGMAVEIAGARHVFEHAGERYYFCCGGCREMFMADPARYLAAAAAGGT